MKRRPWFLGRIQLDRTLAEVETVSAFAVKKTASDN
jgi:hypothetical protein